MAFHVWRSRPPLVLPTALGHNVPNSFGGVAVANEDHVKRIKDFYPWRNSIYKLDLTGANLTGADLRLANLQWANLSEANLSAANLTGADVTGAELHGATYDGLTQWPDGFDPVAAGAVNSQID